MAKDPVLPLYYNDITTSTQDWSDEEFGAYVRLLIHQWRQGGLPKDYQRLTRICTSLDQNWHLIKHKFKEIDGFLKNEYLENVREKRNKHKQKQRDNVLNRYQKSTKQPTKKIPLEIENENEIEVEKEIEKELPFSSEKFARLWETWKAYRGQIKKPYRSLISEQAALKQLSQYTEDVAAKMIEQSIANSWQGLFPIKTNNDGSTKHSRALEEF